MTESEDDKRKRLNKVREKSRKKTHKILVPDDAWEFAEQLRNELDAASISEIIVRVFKIYAPRYRDKVLGILDDGMPDGDTVPLMVKPTEGNQRTVHTLTPQRPHQEPERTQDVHPDNSAVDALATLAGMF